MALVEFAFLTQKFYYDYANCPEIEQKPLRPYVVMVFNIGGISFCIPMRSNINHPHAYFTDKPRKCGLDFSKTVIIKDRALYIDKLTKPHIRQDEFNALRGKERIIETRLRKYIRDYNESKRLLHIPRHSALVRYSTLQYFEESISRIR